MNAPPLRLVRQPTVLCPNQTRVLLRSFQPGDSRRVASIAARVAALSLEEATKLLAAITYEFSPRHSHVERRFLQQFDYLRPAIAGSETLSELQRMVIGSYFLAEYSLESAALFNPSMVPHPDQSNLPAGALRVIISLRATGEGHISSITFRSGIVHANHNVVVAPSTGFLTEPHQVPTPACTLDSPAYIVAFPPELDLSQRILFPGTPAQSNGIEDARFVRFQDDDGPDFYYATFTAYDGQTIRPELLDTTDFLRFRFFSLSGPAARNKGMALFPRKINGRYAMLGRQDNENIHLMYSDSLHFWEETLPLLQPAFPWELVQIGNCGSPLETEAGWLVLSHGVGPMRQYCIGAFLLDLDDPSRVIGRLRQPLLKPNQQEREGYVPNVVYSCGGLIHNGALILPYGIADHATGFASLPLSDLLAAMEPTTAHPFPPPPLPERPAQ